MKTTNKLQGAHGALGSSGLDSSAIVSSKLFPVALHQKNVFGSRNAQRT
jgi:hypothetical protein